MLLLEPLQPHENITVTHPKNYDSCDDHSTVPAGNVFTVSQAELHSKGRIVAT
jgi:hypothetical protein